MSLISTTVSFNNTIQLLVLPQANAQRVIIDIPTTNITIGLGASSLTAQWFPIRSDDTPFYMDLLPGEELWMSSLGSAGQVSVLCSYIDPLGD